MKKVSLTLLFAIMLLSFSLVHQQAFAGSPDKEAKPVSKIVFVDKENCCKCTAERTEKSWNALQAALKAKASKVPVEKYHVDTQADQAGKYKAMKPMVTVPALYFLDAEGNLIEMLQGEVTKEQIDKLL
jgi:hypothetical protein